MFLRCHRRKKDGKEHRYYSVEESRRLQSGKVVQRRVLYLGEINDSQESAWRKSLEVFDERQQRATTLSLFPEDRPAPSDAVDAIQVKLSEMQLRRARPYGNCWLGCELWRQLELDRFWERKLPPGREDVSWSQVLELLVVSRLIDPGSEFRVHRQWFDQSAMDVLLGADFAVAEKDRLYRCLDRIWEDRKELFQHLQQRWKTLFDVPFDVLLYDLTSTYVERAVLEKLATIQALDVCLPTTDGRHLVMPRYTEPDAGRGAAAAPTPARASPTTAAAPRQRPGRRHASTQNVVQTLANRPLKTNGFPAEYEPKCESWVKRNAGYEPNAQLGPGARAAP